MNSVYSLDYTTEHKIPFCPLPRPILKWEDVKMLFYKF